MAPKKPVYWLPHIPGTSIPVTPKPQRLKRGSSKKAKTIFDARQQWLNGLLQRAESHPDVIKERKHANYLRREERIKHVLEDRNHLPDSPTEIQKRVVAFAHKHKRWLTLREAYEVATMGATSPIKALNNLKTYIAHGGRVAFEPIPTGAQEHLILSPHPATLLALEKEHQRLAAKLNLGDLSSNQIEVHIANQLIRTALENVKRAEAKKIVALEEKKQKKGTS